MSDKQWITDKMINLGRDGYIAYLKQNNMCIPNNLPSQAEIDAEKQRQINSKN